MPENFTEPLDSELRRVLWTPDGRCALAVTRADRLRSELGEAAVTFASSEGVVAGAALSC